MSDGVPKSRVTLTYDTRQPEGREKPRELPFRLLVLGDVGGDKASLPLDARRVRQLNGRNLGEVIKGLKIRVPDIPLSDDGARKVSVLIDSMASFAPDDILRLVTGQKSEGPVDPSLRSVWGEQAKAADLWQGDQALSDMWVKREQVIGFQKSYQNSKTLRAALKAFSTPPTDQAQADKRKKAIADMKTQLGPKSTTPAGKQGGTP